VCNGSLSWHVGDLQSCLGSEVSEVYRPEDMTSRAPTATATTKKSTWCQPNSITRRHATARMRLQHQRVDSKWRHITSSRNAEWTMLSPRRVVHVDGRWTGSPPQHHARHFITAVAHPVYTVQSVSLTPYVRTRQSKSWILQHVIVRNHSFLRHAEF